MFNSKEYDVSKDIEVMKIINKNELSIASINMYYMILRQFSAVIGKPYAEIVNEIKELQRDKIVGNEIIRYNPNDSLINDYVHKYMNFLLEKGNQKNSTNLRIKQLLGLLRKSNIETPQLKLKNESTQKKVQLITTDDIRFILKNTNTHNQALISFISSTGVRRYDALHFKIEDFMEACSDYTDDVFLEDFLNNAPDNMIPYFEFIPHKTKRTGLPCKTCCSTEAANLILKSLKMRVRSIETHNRIKNDNLELTEEDALFGSKAKNYVGGYNEKSVSVMFYEWNKKLREHKEYELDEQFRNHELTKKEWRMKKENLAKFHPHALRHRFISTVRQYTTNRDISLLLEGHASSIATDKYYIGESEELFNKEQIKKTYLQVMPYLTFFQNVDPVEYYKELEEKRELQSKLDAMEQRLNKFEEMGNYFGENSVLNNVNFD